MFGPALLKGAALLPESVEGPPKVLSTICIGGVSSSAYRFHNVVIDLLHLQGYIDIPSKRARGFVRHIIT